MSSNNNNVSYIAAATAAWMAMFQEDDDTQVHFEVEDPGNMETIENMRRIQEMGGKMGEIKYCAPDGREFRFESVEELEEFLRMQGE